MATETLEIFAAITDLKIARLLWSANKKADAREAVEESVEKLMRWLLAQREEEALAQKEKEPSDGS